MHRRVVVIVLAPVLALFGLVPAATAGAPSVADSLGDTGHYVALGDSFAAGPFIPLQRADPLGCARSTRNYPALLAADLGVAEFTDVSCSSARTEHMTAAQIVPLGANPPQFDALREDTDLVTVTIGGNDIGYSDIVYTCGLLSASDPAGNPCERQATAGGSDIYAERILAAAPEVAAVLEGITQRSPDATVVLVGYLRILPPSVGCWPVVPVARGDVPYLDGIQQQFTTMLAEQARNSGAVFVDAYAASLGHDVCQAPMVRWVEGVVPTSVTFPVHPNARGMRAVANLTRETLASTPATASTLAQPAGSSGTR